MKKTQNPITSRKGAHDLYQKPSSGAGSEELLLESSQNKGANDWSRDGRFLINTVLDDAAAPVTLLLNWKRPVQSR